MSAQNQRSISMIRSSCEGVFCPSEARTSVGRGENCGGLLASHIFVRTYMTQKRSALSHTV